MLDTDEPDEPDVELFLQAKRMIRAALWVSAMDHAGGRSSQIEERKALIEMIRRLLQEKDYKPLYKVLDMAVENHKAWEQWSRELADLTRELQAAAPKMSLLERQCIYDLAYGVATRFRERGVVSAIPAAIWQSFKNFFRSVDNKVIVGEYINISRLEKSALNELADIFSLPRKILK